MQQIRNFSIIAHVDHGKSTLADRIIQLCGGLQTREMEAQVLDSNPIERERGITIKAQSVSLPYTAKDGQTYQLNFIDTPGHVDFSYEVSRSLAACEGALLVVDAAQGVEAQSVANCYTAVEQGLEVVPILNKIDLPTADVERVKQEIEAVIGIDAEDAVAISAKTGLNIEAVLEAIVALPDQLFYNTGINTYVWVLTNHKPEARKGKVQLINAVDFFVKMKKSLGNKRNELSKEHIETITKLFGDFEASEHSKVFDNEDFGYRRITVERPLRLNFQASVERIERLKEERCFVALAESKKKGATEFLRGWRNSRRVSSSSGRHSGTYAASSATWPGS